jgi:hypothetical protein
MRAPNKMTIKKIPIKQLIDTLVKLYEEGVDYIDINGSEVSDNKDVLHIGVSPDYYNESSVEENKEGESSPKEYTQVLLTQEDIDNLI